LRQRKSSIVFLLLLHIILIFRGGIGGFIIVILIFRGEIGGLVKVILEVRRGEISGLIIVTNIVALAVLAASCPATEIFTVATAPKRRKTKECDKGKVRLLAQVYA
jgi:hypothetical protein